MIPTMWILVLLLPPCLAALIWLYMGVGAGKGDALPWQHVRLGRYGFWIVLGIIYTATFTAAFVEHKL